MKRFTLILFILALAETAQVARAEVILSAVVKDGPNGYNASGTSTTSSSMTGANHTTSSTTNGLSVSDRIQTNMGMRLEYLTKESPLVFGVGAFQDTTIEASVGVRLW